MAVPIVNAQNLAFPNLTLVHNQLTYLNLTYDSLPHPHLQCFPYSRRSYVNTRNRKHRRAAAIPAAYAKPLTPSTLGRRGKREAGLGPEAYL